MIETARALEIPADGSGQLVTDRDFEDFELALEYSLAPAANSGLYLRGARDGENPSYTGYEVQLIDDEGWERAKGATLRDYQHTAGLYAIRGPVTLQPLRPAGEWNLVEARALGARLDVALNGLIVQHVDLDQVTADPPTAERPRRGFVGLQRYGDPDVQGPTAVRVRRFEVRELR